jgi:hypothetical protein
MYNLCYIRTSPHTQQITSNRASPKTNDPPPSSSSPPRYIAAFLSFFPSRVPITIHQNKQNRHMESGKWSQAGSQGRRRARKSFPTSFPRRITTTERGAFHHTHTYVFLLFHFSSGLFAFGVGVGGEVPLSHRAREIAKAFFFIDLTASTLSERASERVSK